MTKKVLWIVGLILLLVTVGFFWSENQEQNNLAPVIEASVIEPSAVETPIVDDKSDLIKVTSVVAGDAITSPLTITGEARGSWFFEATFPIKLLDSKGNIIATTVAQAQGDWMTEEFVPFKATLTFNAVRGSIDGTLVFAKDNPSGLPENENQLTIPVKLPSMTDVTWKQPGILSAKEIENKQIRITTAKGDIVFKLFPDTAPLTVSNFVYLTAGGFYDGLTFHRVEKSPMPFVIQGGDPNGTGTGGPGYKFADELKDSRTYTRGIVAMANSGANTNGSQFFIMLGDTPLPHLYSIFGEVTSGMDVVDQIKKGDVMTSVKIEDIE